MRYYIHINSILIVTCYYVRLSKSKVDESKQLNTLASAKCMIIVCIFISLRLVSHLWSRETIVSLLKRCEKCNIL